MTRLPAMLVRAALPVGILVAGWAVFWVLSREPEQTALPAAAPQAIRTRVTELRVRDYPVMITTHGVIQPHNAVTLSAQVAGQIAHLGPSFETGAFFAAGEVLVELDARDYQITLAVAESRELGARAALKLAQLNHDRNLKLAQDNLISDTVADQSAATLAQTSAEVDSARAQVDRARQDLARTRIRAPFEGRVREKHVGLGQFVGPGTPLGSVFAVDFAEVRLPLDARARAFLSLPGELSNLVTIPPQLTEFCREGENLSFEFKGHVAEAEEARQRTILGGAALLFALYAMLAIPFKSLLQPIFVMLAIPFAIIGALAGHIIMGVTPSYLSVFGMLGLAGVAVNDSLVLVSYINQRRAEGKTLREAALEAGARRFRPILLTAITTFAGLAPLMVAKSLQAQFLIPMAISLGFGVLFCTAITLYLVPCALLMAEDLGRCCSRLREWLLPRPAPLSHPADPATTFDP